MIKKINNMFVMWAFLCAASPAFSVDDQSSKSERILTVSMHTGRVSVYFPAFIIEPSHIISFFKRHVPTNINIYLFTRYFPEILNGDGWTLADLKRGFIDHTMILMHHSPGQVVKTSESNSKFSPPPLRRKI